MKELSVRCQKHARMRYVTDTESYFENFFLEIRGISAKTRRKLMSYICDALHDLVPYVQFKKLEKHPWRSVNFSKFRFFKLYKWYQIAQRITYSNAAISTFIKGWYPQKEKITLKFSKKQLI